MSALRDEALAAAEAWLAGPHPRYHRELFLAGTEWAFERSAKRLCSLESCARGVHIRHPDRPEAGRWFCDAFPIYQMASAMRGAAEPGRLADAMQNEPEKLKAQAGQEFLLHYGEPPGGALNRRKRFDDLRKAFVNGYCIAMARRAAPAERGAREDEAGSFRDLKTGHGEGTVVGAWLDSRDQDGKRLDFNAFKTGYVAGHASRDDAVEIMRRAIADRSAAPALSAPEAGALDALAAFMREDRARWVNSIIYNDVDERFYVSARLSTKAEAAGYSDTIAGALREMLFNAGFEALSSKAPAQDNTESKTDGTR